MDAWCVWVLGDAVGGLMRIDKAAAGDTPNKQKPYLPLSVEIAVVSAQEHLVGKGKRERNHLRGVWKGVCEGGLFF